MRTAPRFLIALAFAGCTGDAPRATPPPDAAPVAIASPEALAHAEAQLADRLASASQRGELARRIDPEGARTIAASMARLGKVRRALHRGEVDRAALEAERRRADAECVRVAGEPCDTLLFTPRRSR